MKLHTKKPLLKFDANQKELTQALSAALFVGETLWLASDELTSVERLTTDDGRTFQNHKSFPLGELISLPASGTKFDQEIDVESLDFHDSHLWVVGSHSLKRKNVKPGASGSDEDLIEKCAKVEREGNRFLLARIPLISDNGRQVLQSPAKVEPGRVLAAAQLPGNLKTNTLVDNIRQINNGQGDEHLVKFLDIPGKDNGFDIEGMAVIGERVFLGLRGPVLRGWAVILELSVDTSDTSQIILRELDGRGRKYRKHLLDLNGLGIRDLCVHKDDLLILAGPTMQLDGPTTIYRWKDVASHQRDSLVRGSDVTGILPIPFGDRTDHAEGFTIVPGSTKPTQVLVVCDSPSAERTKEGPGTIRVDVFDLPLG